MTDTTVDPLFVASMNALLPPMIHALAFHPDNPRGPQLVRDLADHLTSKARLGYVCWDLMAGMRVAVEAIGLTPSRVRAVAGGRNEDGEAIRLQIDDAMPTQRAVTRFVQCGLNEDVETATAILNTVPEDELDLFIKTILSNLILLVRQTQPHGCAGGRP